MTGADAATVHEEEIVVRYAETDQMGVVHHASFLVWFEVARTGLCAKSGHTYAEIEDRGFFLVVTGVEATYRRPARYGETVTVRVWLDRLGSRGLSFAYEVRGKAGRLTTGLTHHVWTARASGRPCRLPDDLQEAFRRTAGLA